MIGIIDYKMGNLASLRNSFEKIGVPVRVLHAPEELAGCDKIVLPGVGAFGDAADHLAQYGFDKALAEFVATGKPLLGICLGMQLLFAASEESPGAKGLGLVDGTVKRFDKNRAAHPIKIPHMGWNRMEIRHDSPLFAGLENGFYLYFVHGYHGADCPDNETVATCYYGYDFPAAVAKGNVFGLQPHPEKSHETGLKILKNFAELA